MLLGIPAGLNGTYLVATPAKNTISIIEITKNMTILNLIISDESS
jgi:hypothetical protein